MIDDKIKPIDWTADDDAKICAKIEARLEETKTLHEVKKKRYNENEAYLEGNQHIKFERPANVYNHVFPIIRNMTGLITDVKPTPGIKIVGTEEDLPSEDIQKLMQLGDNLEQSLNEWWEDNNMQEQLQKLVFSLQVYDDFFLMPYWDSTIDDALMHPVHPRHVHIDHAADDLNNAEFAIIDLFKSYAYVQARWGEKADEIDYLNSKEAPLSEMGGGDVGQSDGNDYKSYKNLAHIMLYIEPEWMCYKVGKTILQKIPNPHWAGSAESQTQALKESITKKYKKDGAVAGTVQAVGDAMKGMVGMETTEDQVEGDFKTAMQVFQPAENFFLKPKIPLIQFSTYRMAGEQYSRSAIKQAIPTVDNLNEKKQSIKENLNLLAKPRVYVHGSMSEEQAAKLAQNKRQIVVLPTTSDLRMQDLMMVVQGSPLPAQVFNDLMDDKAAIDNMFGHHEVSKGASDSKNKTKGGILALQEADQTPVRYLTRNLEASLQDTFQWVVQLRKVNKKKVSIGTVDDRSTIDYTLINKHYKVFVKSGTMMPVSREQQRIDAREEFQVGLIDPLTYHERVNTPDPEKTAKRLELWVTEHRVQTEEDQEQEAMALQLVELIKANKFDEAIPMENHNPQVFHDMLVMALKQNVFTSPQQEQHAATLIQTYAQAAGKPVDNMQQPTPAV